MASTSSRGCTDPGRIRVSSQCLLALQPWRHRAYLAKGVTLGLIPSRREVVVTDPSLSGWGAVWQHRAVTPMGGHIWYPRPECLQLWVWPLRGLIHL
ncbi:unnamed protein product [Boreogadus saida]